MNWQEKLDHMIIEACRKAIGEATAAIEDRNAIIDDLNDDNLKLRQEVDRLEARLAQVDPNLQPGGTERPG